MREIKFRVWDGKRMGYATLKDLCEVAGTDETGRGQDAVLDFAATVQDAAYLQASVVMQHTGLKDAAGADIYEGDIVREYDDESGAASSPDWVAAVVFRDGAFRLAQFHGQWLPEERDRDNDLFRWTQHGMVLLIGNIYEHPDLLAGSPATF